MIIAGVQKPHWRPCSSMKPCWTGSSPSAVSMSSIVRTSWPEVMAASVVHDLTGSPSIRTTQAPQLEVSQPQWVPVSPRVSRRKWTSSSRGSTSPVCGSPLTVIVTSMSDLRSQGARRGPAQCPAGQLAGQMALVVCGSALVVPRGAVLGGDGRRAVEQLLRGSLAGKGLLGSVDLERRRPEVGQPDARVGDGPAVDPQRHADRGDGPVAHPPLDLLVRAAVARAHGDPHLAEQFSVLEHGLEGPGLER